MKSGDSPFSSDVDREVSALISTLHETGRRLEELTAGEIDTVADFSGRTFVLQHAQDQLRDRETARQSAVLNALPANIALIDAQGSVVSVNEAWRRFGDANVMHADASGIGLNYLGICDSASGRDSTEAHDVAMGIRRVLCGEAPSFSLEYPCHSPTQKRWFLMVATPLDVDHPNGAVVMHLDITKRVQIAEEMERQRSELRALFDVMPALIWFKDTHNNILRVNKLAADAAGKSVAEMEGASASVIYPDTAQRYFEDDLEVIASRKPKLGIVEPVPSPDGTSRWVQTDKVLHFDKQGNVAGIVVMAQDVTERRLAAEAEKRSQQHLRGLIDGLGPSLFAALLTPDGVMLEVSESPLIAAGLRREDVLGKPFADTHWWSHSPAARKQLRAAIKRGARGVSSRYDVCNLGMDGKLIDLDFSLHPLRDEAGRVVYLVPSASVITERTLAQQALQASEREQRESARLLTFERARLLAAQRVAKVGDWEIDLSGDDVLWSEELYRIHEADPATFVTTRHACLQLVDPRDRTRVAETLLASLSRHEPSVAEHRLCLDGHRTKFLEERWQVLFDERGVATRVVGTCQDITERKLSEMRIHRLNRGYLVLSHINALVVRVHARDELFREACRIAVEVGDFALAWIGVVDPTLKAIVPVASAGADDQFLEQLEERLSLIDHAPNGHGPAALAVRDGRDVIVNDVEADSRILDSDRHTSRGIHSLISLPIIVADEVVAVLGLHAADVGYFDDAEVKLLCDLAGDIAFAIDHIEKQERLDYLAFYDPTTGLANQSLFLERLQAKLLSAHARQDLQAVIVLDIQRFKAVNDAFGRCAGDELLRLVAKRLVEVGRDPTRFARIGADRFAIVATDLESVEQLGRYVEQRLDATFRAPFHVEGNDVRVSVKVGIARFPEDGTEAETLLRNAEAALKKAKVSGDRFVFFNQAMTARVAERLTLENRLREALDNEEFVLHYQPKVNLDSGLMTGAEALIRWNDPRTGLVPPNHFIPILEETGLIHEVGRWALRKAIADYLRWRDAGHDAPRIAVNVSPLQLRDRSFVAEVTQALSMDEEAAAGLELEITESLIMEDVKHSIASLQAVRDLGVTIAIDDFGTGFSSLSYLSKLPVDTLKIDRSFVNDLTTGPEGLALVSTIITLAHSLKLKVVAEGVETEEQSRFLRLLRCDQMQGYLYSRPVPADVFEENFLRQAAKPPGPREAVR